MGTLNTRAYVRSTCVQNFRVCIISLKNGVDIWTFVRWSAKITAWYRNYLVLEYIVRFWALILTCLILVVRSTVSSSSICWSKNFVRSTNMPWSTWKLEAARPEKKWVIFFLPTVNSWLSVTVINLFEGLWLVGTRFQRKRQSYIGRLCHPLPHIVHGGQHDHPQCVAFE